MNADERRWFSHLALLILGMKTILHTFKTLVETFHGTSLHSKTSRTYATPLISCSYSRSHTLQVKESS
ncbi:MAG TPA: hypothetical protein VK184_24210 [Nostocaceae cyanobacterium]|nr:hypothetical protein [Nostocaceae cyanobacterium]